MALEKRHYPMTTRYQREARPTRARVDIFSRITSGSNIWALPDEVRDMIQWYVEIRGRTREWMRDAARFYLEGAGSLDPPIRAFRWPAWGTAPNFGNSPSGYIRAARAILIKRQLPVTTANINAVYARLISNNRLYWSLYGGSLNVSYNLQRWLQRLVSKANLTNYPEDYANQVRESMYYVQLRMVWERIRIYLWNLARVKKAARLNS